MTNIMDHDKVLEKFLQRFEAIEERLSSLEIRIRTLGENGCEAQKGKLINELADNVSSLVGLREAITWRRRSIKITWAILLCLGLIATTYYIFNTTKEYLVNPTATNVELQRKTEYEYPHLVLCPGAWVDTKKALSTGLSMEALKYSIAYLDNFAVDNTTNVTRAREEFYHFYERHNFSSLLEYYRAIAIEVRPKPSMAAFAASTTSSYYCSGCNESAPLKNVVVEDALCYAFSLKPADARHFRTWSTAPKVYVKIQDLTEGVVQVTSNWKSYLMADQHLTQPNFPSITIEPFSITTLKTSVQMFLTMGVNNVHCLEPEKAPKNYSAETCTVMCLHKVFYDTFKCGVFSYSANDEFEEPSHYCNYFDELPGTNTSFLDFFSDNETDLTASKEGEACINKCPHVCDRMIYTSTLDSAFKIVLDAYNITGVAREHNMSFVAVHLDNTAISQGGILTLTEVSTFSFSTLVSNIGGTLGLFVGGTILTIFQLILFLVNYALDVKEERQRSKTPV